jgi:Uncharacterized stress protein (general stress protein 26)
MNQEDKKLVLNFIKKNKIAVLATVDINGHPEAAAIEFGETDELEIIFDTLKSYRKYANLGKNQSVALVIGWDDDITVQYEGKAVELDAEESGKYQEIYFAKNPEARRWTQNPEIRYFKVIPTWIRYSDLKSKPWKIIELTF